MNKKILIPIAVLVAIIILMEVTASSSYKSSTGEKFSSSKLKKELKKLSKSGTFIDGKMNTEKYMGIHTLHPYLGFNKNREARPKANEYGLMGTDPVLKKADNTVNICLTGGSIALHYYQHARKEFIAELKKHSYFKNKTINFTPIALEGYKQPQQLISLNYFMFLGAEYNIVINIDGVNDITLPINENLKQGVNPFFPRAWNMYGSKSIDMRAVVALAETNTLKKQQVELAKESNSFPTTSSRYFLSKWAQENFELETKINESYANYTKFNNQLPKKSFQINGPSKKYASNTEMYTDIASKWSNGALQMHMLCKEKGAKFFQFLEPNQYVPNSKTLTAEENQIANINSKPENVRKKSPSYYNSIVIRDGYQFLQKEGNKLKEENGMLFYDLTTVFKGVDQSVYKDDCCHLNKKGNELMAKRIAKLVLENY